MGNRVMLEYETVKIDEFGSKRITPCPHGQPCKIASSICVDECPHCLVINPTLRRLYCIFPLKRNRGESVKCVGDWD